LVNVIIGVERANGASLDHSETVEMID